MKLIKIFFKTFLAIILILVIYLGFIFIKPLIFTKNSLNYITYKNINSEEVKINLNKKTNIFLFDPDCFSCNKIKNRINKNEETYFITDNPNKKLIKDFIVKNNLEKYSTHFLIDYELKSFNEFNLGPVIKFPILITIYKEEKSIVNL